MQKAPAFAGAFAVFQKNADCTIERIPSPRGKVAQQIHLKKHNQMNLVSRMRNAGDAPRYCTTWEPIPLSNTGRGTHIGNRPTFPPAFLFSLVFTVRRTFEENVSASKRTENSTASPRGKQYLKANFAGYILITLLQHAKSRCVCSGFFMIGSSN